MKAFEVYSRVCNANTADGYDDYDDGITYFADSKDEAAELYLDDMTYSLGQDVRDVHSNCFGNPVDFETADGIQRQLLIKEVSPSIDNK